MSVFTNSSALVALFNPQDPNHNKAKLITKKYKIKSFAISDYIFAETVLFSLKKLVRMKPYTQVSLSKDAV